MAAKSAWFLCLSVTFCLLIFYGCASPPSTQVQLSLHAESVILGGSFFANSALMENAEGIAVSRGKIVGFGKSEEIAKYIGPNTRVYSYPGGLILPGFFGVGTIPLDLDLVTGGKDLSNVKTFEELATVLHEFFIQNPDSDLFLGHSFHSHILKGEARGLLQRVNPSGGNQLVVLVGEDGSSAWVNSLEPLSNENNRLSLQVRAAAGDGYWILLPDGPLPKILSSFPEPSSEAKVEALRSILQEARQRGITYLEGRACDFETYRTLQLEGKLTSKIGLWEDLDLPSRGEAGDREAESDYPFVELKGLRKTVDGSLASGTAYVSESRGEEERNATMRLQGKLISQVVEEDAAGTQLSLKATGDGAVALAIRAFQEAIRANGKRESRHRIEGIQLMPEGLEAKIPDLGISLGVELPLLPREEEKFIRMLEREREPPIFPSKRFLMKRTNLSLRAGGKAGLMDPLAVLRSIAERARNQEDQFLTMEEALRALTLLPAFSSFQENEEGSLTPGKLANIVVLSRDPRKAGPEEIKDIEVLATFFRGEPVFLTEQ